MKLIQTCKLCKYCKKPGKFNPILRRVLCDEHQEMDMQFRSMWQAIVDLQMSPSGQR
ncbi:MAG: hypothetical protein ABIB47_05120 [Candidatus Woesearchaeota archaeon]